MADRTTERGESHESSGVTRLLRAFTNGRKEALDEVIPLVYTTLRRAARRQLRGERRDHTLSSAALVHEAYLELARLGTVEWQDRKHFLRAAARAMRHILVDYAVRRKAQKRGGDFEKVPFETAILKSDEQLEDIITLHGALERLEQLDEQLVRVVECRYFAGLTIQETAETMDLSEATVSRYWTRARAWLNRELRPQAPREQPEA